jgi:hypothetical protein
VLLNGRSRIRNSLNQSRAATCRISHAKSAKSEVILRDAGKQVQNWLKRSQFDRAFFSSHDEKQKAC